MGDLSRDIDDDSNFPKKNDYKLILDYLRDENACDGAIQTFKDSWSKYMITLHPTDFIKFRDSGHSRYYLVD